MQRVFDGPFTGKVTVSEGSATRLAHTRPPGATPLEFAHVCKAWARVPAAIANARARSVAAPIANREPQKSTAEDRKCSQLFPVEVSLVFVSFFALIILPALDHRFGWSPVAPWVSLLGDVIIVLSFLLMFWVIKVNSFAASNIRVEEGQQVIDTGPYAYVRHPMYAGAFWLLVGIPLALGSWWGLGLIVPFLPVLLWRLLDEEKILNAQLRGYTEYTQKVRYRLIPFVW